MDAKKLPLEGVRIADLTMVWAGPYATKLLADMGAEIVKVESIRNYDMLRDLHALPPETERAYNKSAYFNHNNRNKLSVTLDLGHPKGKAVFLELVKISDAVVENYRADVVDKLGLGYDVLRQVKPDIIMVSMPAHGKTGPEKDFVGYGANIEQLSGLVSIGGYHGGHVLKTGISYGDPAGGIAAAGAIATALHYRRRTGRGQYIDLAQRENLTCVVGEAVMDWTMNRRMWKPMGNRHTSMAPHGCYPCQGDDQWVTIAVGSDEEWQALCRALGNPEWTQDERFADGLSRWHNQEEIDRHIAEWTSGRKPYEVTHLLQCAGVAAGPVLGTRQLIADPHLEERGYFETVTHKDAGTWRMEGPVWRTSETPASIRWNAPCFGEHNDYVLKELLGLSDGEIAEMEGLGIVGAVPLEGKDR